MKKMLVIENNMLKNSGCAYEYNSTLKVVPLDDAITIAKSYAIIMIQEYQRRLASETTISDNNHNRSITEEEIMNFNIELL